jgi:hypothetical protein
MDTDRFVELVRAASLLERVLEGCDDAFAAQVVAQAIGCDLARRAAREVVTSREAATALIVSLEVNLGELNDEPVDGHIFLKALLTELRAQLS